MPDHEFKTKRLLLRNWKESDIAPFVAMGLDEQVMKYFPGLLSEEQSRGYITQKKAAIDAHGWGLWAVEEIASAEFIGFVGLQEYDMPMIESIQFPLIEVGWRLRSQFWNKGYATEAALECLRFGFETLQLKEIVSFTSLQNVPSFRVMQKIGMHRNPSEDFDHPRVEEGDELRRHLLYRLTREEWELR